MRSKLSRFGSPKDHLQRAALDAQIAETQAVAHASAIKKVRPLMSDYGPTEEGLPVRTSKAGKTADWPLTPLAHGSWVHSA